MQFGGLRIDRPIVELAAGGRGRNTLGDGIIGLPLIRRLNLSIAAREHVVWAQPSRQEAVPERYGLSGIWLDQRGDTVVIAAVGTGSPAAAAGLKIGDRVIGDSLDAAIAKLGGGPGRDVTFKVASGGGAPRDVTLTLKAYL